MAQRTRRLFAGLATAAGAALIVKGVLALLEERRCRLHPLRKPDWDVLRVAGRAAVAAAVQRGGVSAELRAEVWPLLLGSQPDAAAYDALQRRCDALDAAGGDADARYSEARRVIAVDVPRTPLPEPPGSAAHAEAAARLTRLLRAFAVHDPPVSYCQGMSEIAARFLRVFPDDEASAFAAFAAFVTAQRESFLADVSQGVCVRLRRVDALMARADPAVGAHLRLLRADDCQWLLRPVVVLMLRELPPCDVATFFDVLMVRRVATAHCVILHRSSLGAGDTATLP